MLRIVLQYLQILGSLAAFWFFVRLCCAPFSAKIQDQMRRHRTLHCLWGCWAFAMASYVYVIIYPWAWPPAWVERRSQRQKVLARVQSAGGWAALKRECDALADAHRDDLYEFRWHRGFDTNPLPPAVAALKPRDIQFYPRSMVRQFRGESARWLGTNVVFRILVFGAHSSGGHSEPPLGLEVLCEPGVTNYSPARLRSSTPLRYWRYREVAADVYEFY